MSAVNHFCYILARHISQLTYERGEIFESVQILEGMVVWRLAASPHIKNEALCSNPEQTLK